MNRDAPPGDAPAAASAAVSASAPAGAGSPPPPAQIAKAALRRLALERREPTPQNFASAYAAEAGDPRLEALGPSVEPPAAAPPSPLASALLAQAPRQVADGQALAGLIERIVRGVDQGGKQWTRARRRESLQRVLTGSRSDADRLQQRLDQLVSSWQADTPDGQAATAADLSSTPAGPAPTVSAPRASGEVADGAEAASAPDGPTPDLHEPQKAGASGAPPIASSGLAPPEWARASGRLGQSLVGALPRAPAGVEASAAVVELAPAALADRLAVCTARLGDPSAGAAEVRELEGLCAQADRVLQHREHLLEQLGRLAHELTDSLGELAEDDRWAQGQIDAMREVLDAGLSTRGVRSVAELLRLTRERQGRLRNEREQARDALKALIQRMLGELGELGAHTGRFHESMDRYAGVIERADSLESLTGVVREMVEESRTVAGLVSQTQSRLQAEHQRAETLAGRVETLEEELRRLSAEVSTDQLTQIANRRGLIARFELEQARQAREGATLCVALLDIDNFKRLNDELGHAAGDTALKALAQAVSQALRPTDHVARFGGEEFVVLLPDTALDEARQILTRLQRGLSGSLFLHEERPIFVTFSAGVTAYRPGEPLEAALERADVGLYEAKRTGKNRTCGA